MIHLFFSTEYIMSISIKQFQCFIQWSDQKSEVVQPKCISWVTGNGMKSQYKCMVVPHRFTKKMSVRRFFVQISGGLNLNGLDPPISSSGNASGFNLINL